ncbi:MAG: AAA family ATPase, partial [Lamprobacter sp.]|nr:AAA family ATPase [Lamprobacter sp.]
VDVLFEEGTGLRAVEIKSGATLVNNWLRSLHRWQELAGDRALPPWLIYGGDEAYQREGVEVVPWRAVL